jgi:hypothetical protein
MIKRRGMKCKGNTVRMAQTINAYTILVVKSEGTDHFEDLAVNEMIILQYT